MFSSSIGGTILWALIRLPMVLLAITFHETAHGFIAYRLGDPTAKNQGRLSLNPIKHIDWIGAICMLICRFGWAKPVPVNPNYFKNKKWGMALVALAGPLSNILLAFITMLVIYTTTFIFPLKDSLVWIGQLLDEFFILNLSLAVFNFIPIPPLDGAKILGAFLPAKHYFALMEFERFGMVAMLFLLFAPRISDGFFTILSYGVSWFANGLYRISALLLHFFV